MLFALVSTSSALDGTRGTTHSTTMDLISEIQLGPRSRFGLYQDLVSKAAYWTLISTPTVLLIRSAKRSTWGLPPFRVGIETTRGSSISFLLFPSLSFIQSKTGSVTITKDTSCFALISSKVFTASS